MEKYLIATDVHGSLEFYNKLEKRIEVENPTTIIFLGDLYYHGPRNPLPQGYSPMEVCQKIKGLKNTILIKGNCDAEVDEMITEREFEREVYLQINGRNFLFTHGHKLFEQKQNLKGVDFVVYGHTHINELSSINDTTLINLSSISLPKQNAERCYMIIDDKIEIKNLQGEKFNYIKL